jgi:lysine biosynthesis protein LysW
MTTSCPVCKNETELYFPPKIGQLVTCQVCKTTLEVIWLFPVSLDPVEEQSNAFVNTQDDLS